MKNLPEKLLCFSHLQWDFVFQRPQHLFTRFSQQNTIYFFEEPLFDADDESYLTISKKLENLWVCVPHLPAGLEKSVHTCMLVLLLNKFTDDKLACDFMFWYYTPMAFEYSSHFNPAL